MACSAFFAPLIGVLRPFLNQLESLCGNCVWRLLALTTPALISLSPGSQAAAKAAVQHINTCAAAQELCHSHTSYS